VEGHEGHTAIHTLKFHSLRGRDLLRGPPLGSIDKGIEVHHMEAHDEEDPRPDETNYPDGRLNNTTTRSIRSVPTASQGEGDHPSACKWDPQDEVAVDPPCAQEKCGPSMCSEQCGGKDN